MPGAGIEPARPEGHGILSPVRLPVPPPRLQPDSLRLSGFAGRPDEHGRSTATDPSLARESCNPPQRHALQYRDIVPAIAGNGLALLYGSKFGQGEELRTVTAGLLLVAALTLITRNGSWLSKEPLSPERAVVERAAIHHDLRQNTGTLYAIAAKRAKSERASLRDRSIVCAISNIDIQFVNEFRAKYAVSYACGVRPWQLGRDEPIATPTIVLDVLKEHGTWLINGFL